MTRATSPTQIFDRTCALLRSGVVSDDYRAVMGRP